MQQPTRADVAMLEVNFRDHLQELQHSREAALSRAASDPDARAELAAIDADIAGARRVRAQLAPHRTHTTQPGEDETMDAAMIPRPLGHPGAQDDAIEQHTREHLAGMIDQLTAIEQGTGDQLTLARTAGEIRGCANALETVAHRRLERAGTPRFRPDRGGEGS